MVLTETPRSNPADLFARVWENIVWYLSKFTMQKSTLVIHIMINIMLYQISRGRPVGRLFSHECFHGCVLIENYVKKHRGVHISCAFWKFSNIKCEQFRMCSVMTCRNKNIVNLSSVVFIKLLDYLYELLSNRRKSFSICVIYAVHKNKNVDKHTNYLYLI